MAGFREYKLLVQSSIVAKGCKKYFVAHILIAAAVLYLLYTIGGGLVPHMPFLRIDSDVHTLEFFNVHKDASKITWARSTNSREAVQKAVSSKVHMIEGDVILQGQGTPHQKLIPVMGRPEDGESGLPLVEWLAEVRGRGKGVKLDFSTIDAVEIALQRMREFNSQSPLRVPVWIHADVLPGPHGGKVKVDPSRFFQTLQREFPQCTLSVGWMTGTHTDLSQSGYSWDAVMDMRQLLQKWSAADQPVVFEARLSLVRNSVPQLKWLVDNVPHSALSVVHVERDAVLSEDLMYIAYRFPPKAVFFDLNHRRFEAALTQFRHSAHAKVSHYVTRRDRVMFRHHAWLKMGFYIQKDSILPSTESLILTQPIVYIVSKAHHPPSPHVALQGRVQFLDRNGVDPEAFSTGLNVYTRAVSYANFEHIVGVRCFVGVDGEVEVRGSDLAENVPTFRRTARITPSADRCFRFRVTDTGPQVILQVWTLHDCRTLESVAPDDDAHLTLTADIPPQLTAGTPTPFIVKTEDNKRQAVIDELSIQSSVE